MISRQAECSPDPGGPRASTQPSIIARYMYACTRRYASSCRRAGRRVKNTAAGTGYRGSEPGIRDTVLGLTTYLEYQVR